MSKLNRLQYIMKLEEEKRKLERQKKNIDLEIKEYQDSCAHMYAHLCYIGDDDDYVCRCVLCGKEVIALKSETEDESFIDAVLFLEQKILTWPNPKYSDIKYQYIQNFVFSILKEQPNISRKELFQQIKNLIKKNISLYIDGDEVKDYDVELTKLIAKSK